MTSSVRLAIALTASIFATATLPAAAASADGLPAGSGIDAAPVSAPGGGPEYLTRSVRRASVVEARERGGGALLRAARIRGDYAVPAVAYDGSASGLSADGRTLVLINPRTRFPRARTTFAILDAERLRVRRKLTLRGDFSFDALSPDGSLMYLINYVSPRDQTRYRVRVYDLRAGRLLAKPVLDPNEPPDEMSGLPITRATSPDGRWAYTLYDGAEHPFIHALDTERRRAVCVDLDLGHLRQGLYGLRLDVPPEGSPLTVVAGNRTLARVDAGTFRVTEPRAENAPREGNPARDGGSDKDGTPWLLVAAGSAALLLAAAVRQRARRRRRPRQAGIIHPNRGNLGHAWQQSPEPGARDGLSPQARRPEAEQLHDLRAGPEGVGHGDIAVEGQGRPELASDFGQKNLAGQRIGAVDRREAFERSGIVARSEADGQCLVGHVGPREDRVHDDHCRSMSP